MRHAQPARQRFPVSRRTAYLDVSALHRARKIDAPEAHQGECPDHAFDLEVYVVAGILHAQVDVGAREHEPVRSILVLPKAEENDHTLIGKAVDANQSTERPPQKIGIEAIVLEVLARPIISPPSERFDDGTEGATGWRQAIGVLPCAVAVELLDEPTSAQRLEALSEEVFRHPWTAPMDVVEAKLAMQALAEDERRPAFGEDLGAHRDRTELTVEGHGAKVPSALSGRKFRL